ncbi:MAG: tetratricopeptide repeat protein [Candidatus Bipolaricaulaceae bacterium]
MPKKAKGAKGQEKVPKKRPILARLRLALLLWLLATQPLLFSPWNTEYGYVKSLYTLVLVGALLLLWAGEMARTKTFRLEWTWLGFLIPAFLGAALLSLTGPTPTCVVLQSAALFFGFGLLFLLVANAEEEAHSKILTALLLGAFLNALFGLLQYLGLAPGGAEGRGPGAMIATMGNQQFLAGFLSYLVFPGLILLRAPKGWILAALAVAFNFAVMLLTQQIGVRLGLGVALAFVAFGLGFWRVRLPRPLRWGLAALLGLTGLGATLGGSGLLAGGAFAVGGVGLFLLGRTLRRFPLLGLGVAAALAAAVVLLLPTTTPLSAVRDLWQRKSGAIRAWDWWVGYEMWRDYPGFGIGLGGYKIFFVPYKPKFLASPRGAAYAFPFPRADQAHNEYVQVAAELGTLGAFLLLAGLGLLAYLGLGRLTRQRDPEKRLELLLLGGGILTALVHAVPTFPFHLPASSLAFVALLGLALSPRYGPLGSFALTLRGGFRWLGVALAAALGVAFLVFPVRDGVADGFLLSAQAAYYLGRLDLAEAQIERAVRLDFCPRVSLYWLGLIKARAGKFPEAKAAWQTCRRLYCPEALYLNLAGVHLQLGEYKEARALLGELLATVPFPEQARDAAYYLAVAELGEGRLLEAKARLEELVRADPQYERAWILLGEVAKRRYLWDEAKGHYQRALHVLDGKIAQIQERLGRPLPLKEHGELQGQLSALQEMRRRVLQALEGLP